MEIYLYQVLYHSKSINKMISIKHKFISHHQELSLLIVKDHPIDQVIRDSIQGIRTRWALKETCEYAAFISQINPKNFKESKLEKSWINVM